MLLKSNKKTEGDKYSLIQPNYISVNVNISKSHYDQLHYNIQISIHKLIHTLYNKCFIKLREKITQHT